MDNRNIESLTPEVKILFDYTLKDMFIMLGIMASPGVLFPVVYEPLQPFYIGFVLFVSFWAIKKNKFNPDKRRYQVIMLLLNRDRQCYHMIEEEAILREEQDLE